MNPLKSGLPGPLDLLDQPERAALAVLTVAARAAQRALVAAHMELWDADDTLYDNDPPPAACAAHAVLEHADHLVRAIERYEQALRARDRARDPTGAMRDPITPWRWPATGRDGHRGAALPVPRR